MELGVDPTAVDLESLADFAGLAEMVRHNPCRIDLQLTFRILLLAGLEIDLFRDYAPRSLVRRRQGLKSATDRLDGLTQFVEEWALNGDPTRRLVRDMLRHEHAIATLRDAEVPAHLATGSIQPSGSAIPMHNGHLTIHHMTCDPRQVGRVLRAREPDLADITWGLWTFGYHKTAHGPLRMLEVERPVGDLLLAVDGRTSTDGIARRLFGADAATGQLWAAFTQLTALGLLIWRPDGKAVPCG